MAPTPLRATNTSASVGFQVQRRVFSALIKVPLRAQEGQDGHKSQPSSALQLFHMKGENSQNQNMNPLQTELPGNNTFARCGRLASASQRAADTSKPRQVMAVGVCKQFNWQHRFETQCG